MQDKISITPITAMSGTVYRRDHRKQDGRLLSLYGLSPPVEAPLPELLREAPPVSELRYDPLRGQHAIYTPQRQARTFQPGADANPLAAARPGGALTEIPFRQFEVAIFENRFTSLSFDRADRVLSPWADAPACGQCEVVVYSDNVADSLASIPTDRSVLLIEALCDRYRYLAAKGAAYVLPFENRGERVGVTLAHPHGQIYAFADVPPPQQQAVRAFASGYDLIAAHEGWGGRFDITCDDDLVAFCPPFARFPYETWIMPRFACKGPWELGRDGTAALGRLLGDIVRRLDQLFGEPMPYMMSFQAAPTGLATPFQFTVQFLPLMRDAGRQKFLAGVEQFTGLFTVDILPEVAADRLRMLDL